MIQPVYANDSNYLCIRNLVFYLLPCRPYNNYIRYGGNLKLHFVVGKVLFPVMRGHLKSQTMLIDAAFHINIQQGHPVPLNNSVNMILPKSMLDGCEVRSSVMKFILVSVVMSSLSAVVNCSQNIALE